MIRYVTLIALLFCSCKQGREYAPIDFIRACERAVAENMKREYQSELEFKKAMLQRFDAIANKVAKHYDFNDKEEFYEYYEQFRDKDSLFSDRVDRMNQVLAEFTQLKWPERPEAKNGHHHNH